jgi:hypothetical protein
MEVCETCGAFILIGDAQKRIEAHFEGRQHNGWARIRETLSSMREARRSRLNKVVSSSSDRPQGESSRNRTESRDRHPHESRVPDDSYRRHHQRLNDHGLPSDLDSSRTSFYRPEGHSSHRPTDRRTTDFRQSSDDSHRPAPRIFSNSRHPSEAHERRHSRHSSHDHPRFVAEGTTQDDDREEGEIC